MQYKTTVELEQGTSVVVLPGDTREDVYTGHEFVLPFNHTYYQITTDGDYDAGEDHTSYSYNATFTGDTASYAATFHRDFTEDNLPLMHEGDIETPVIFSRAMTRTQELVLELRTLIETGGGNMEEIISQLGSRTIAEFKPSQVELPDTDPAVATTRNGHPVIRYEKTTRKRAMFRKTFPRDYTTGPVVVFLYWTATETTGKAAFDVAFNRLAGEDSIDTVTFGAWEISERAAPEAAGQVRVSAVLFEDPASLDFVEPGNLYQMRVARNVSREGAEAIDGDVDLLGAVVFWLGDVSALDDYFDSDDPTVVTPGDEVPDPDEGGGGDPVPLLGEDWDAQTLPSGMETVLQDVYWDPHHEVFLTCAEGKLLAKSADGETWDEIFSPDTATFVNVSGDGSGRVVLTGYDTGDYLYSDDLENWTAATTVSRATFDLAYGGGTTFVCGAGNGRVIRSTNNGGTWANVNVSGDTSTVNIRAIGFNNGRYVIGTEDGKLYYSDNVFSSLTEVTTLGFGGSTIWRVRSNGLSSGTVWMAVGSSGKVAVSTDNGATWTHEGPILDGDDLRSLVHVDGTWFVGTETGRIAYSSDNGDTWTESTGHGFSADTDTDRVGGFAWDGADRVIAVGGRSSAPARSIVSLSIGETEDSGGGDPGGGDGPSEFGPIEALLFTDNWNGSEVELSGYNHGKERFGLVDGWNPVPLVNDPLGSGRKVGRVDVYRDQGHSTRTMFRGHSEELNAVAPGLRNIIPGTTHFYGFAHMWPSSSYAVRDWDSEIVWQYNQYIPDQTSGDCIIVLNPPVALAYRTKVSNANKNNPFLVDPFLQLTVRGDSRECWSAPFQKWEQYQINLPSGKVLWDVWYHFVVEVRWSKKNTTDLNDPECGYLRLWISENGGPYVQYVDDVGMNLYHRHAQYSQETPSPTFGLYKHNKWEDNNVLTDGGVDVNHRRMFTWGYRIVDKNAGGTFYRAATLFNP